MPASELRAQLAWCTRQVEQLDIAIDGAHEQLVSAIAASTLPDHDQAVIDARGRLADLRAEQALWQQLADETRTYLAGIDVDDDTDSLFPAPTPEPQP